MNFIIKILIMLIAVVNQNGHEEISRQEDTYIEESTYTEVSDYEYNLLLRVCMSECGGQCGEPLEGKIAVVETILNRADMYEMTIEEVVTSPYQYSMANNGEPDESVRQAVDAALQKRIYPSNMLYFRAGNYHDFGTPYKKIGNHYFSLEGGE